MSSTDESSKKVSTDVPRSSSLPATNLPSSGFLGNDIRPSVLSLLTLSTCCLFLASFPLSLGSFLSLIMSLLAHEWYHIHGNQLTRKELIFFDEKGLLETTTGYENILLEDTPTPGPGQPQQRIEPLSIWETLFCDEKKMSIQNFYKTHYGPVWSTVERNRKERKLKQKLTRLK